jgi:murein L,D-transpeptidase YcbB/YkuD
MALPGWIALLLFLALAGPVPAEEQPAAAMPAGMRERVEALAKDARPRVAGVELASMPVLAEFYRQRDYRRVWQRQGQVSDLLRAIARSPEEGLSPSDFHDRALAGVFGDKDLAGLTGEARDHADLLLTDGLLRYLHHRLFGKVDPVAVDRKLYYAEPPTLEELAMQLRAALDAPALGDHLSHLVREPAFYAQLKEGLARYRVAAANGGWGLIPAGGKLAPGARDQRVVALRERLRASGEYQGPIPADPKVYDQGLQEAVKAFQKAQGMPANGVVGGRAMTELNVPAAKRIEQIRVNLERMRWVYRDLPEDYLLVDVVGFQVHLMRGAETQWSTRAQVGRADRQTPTFRDQLEYLELNPTWTVPPTILKDDILPKARVNPGYVAKKGLKAIDRNGRSVPLSAVNWNLPAKAFPYSLRQDGGGAKAALGKIKFMFPNRFSVYLHDTPSRHLFNQPVRMTSSGCVRVDKPFELAERVLGEPERWSVRSLQGLVASGKTRTVRLKEPMDVILAYWTAEGLGDGRVRFRGDAYGRDATLLAALGREAGLRVKLPPPPEPEPALDPVPGPTPPGISEPVAPLGPTTPTEAKGAPVTQVREPEVAAGASAPGLPPVSRL